jgi:plastocyanin
MVMPRGLVVMLAAIATLLVALPAGAATKQQTLIGTVGTMGNADAFVINLTLNGKKVTKLKPGVYVIRIVEKSAIHNFRLLKGKKTVKGTNLATRKSANVTTTVPGKAGARFRVKLTKGKYTYQCDPHVPPMIATFTVA